MFSGIDSTGAGVISIKKILSSLQAFLICLCSLFSISGYTKSSIQVRILKLMRKLVLTVHHSFVNTLMNTPSLKIIENHLSRALIKTLVPG